MDYYYTVHQDLAPMPKRLAPVKTASKAVGDIVAANSAIPELLCIGVFFNARTRTPTGSSPTTASRLLSYKIASLQSYRMLGHEYRKIIDTFILQVMSELRTKAVAMWIAKRGYQLLRDRRSEDSSKMKEVELQWNKSTVDLDEHMELYFPKVVVAEYIEGINCESYDSTQAEREKSTNLLYLRFSVSMFFAMATQRCYLHTCGGYCKCTKTRGKSSFNKLEYTNASGVCKEVCVFADISCIREFTVKPRTACNTNSKSVMALEMFRRRGTFGTTAVGVKIDKVLSALGAPPRDTMFVMTHPDIDVQSIQSMLCITDAEVATCKAELKRKAEEKQRLKKEVAKLKIAYHLKDVQEALRTNSRYGFENLEDASKVLPGVSGVIKNSISNEYFNESCFQMPMVGSCLNELSFLMGPIRRRDTEFDDSGMASWAAYDFMSGKSNGILYEYVETTLEVYSFQGASYLHSFELDDESAFLDGVCVAMRIFDKIDERWKVTDDGNLKAPQEIHTAYKKGRSKYYICKASQPYYKLVKNYMLKVHGDLLPDFQHNNPELMREVFPILAARPTTKCFAMGLLGWTPRSLWNRVTAPSSSAMLKALGIGTKAL